MATKIRVLIADDHPVIRRGLRDVLAAAPDIEVVGDTGDAAAVPGLVAQLSPDVLLLDLVMPGSHPCEIIRANPRPTLILTGHDDRGGCLAQVILAGVVGVIKKGIDVEPLLHAVRQAARGELLITRAQWTLAREWQAAAERWSVLTNREREVLRLVVAGQNTPAIAAHLQVSPHTIETHISNALTKLGVDSRTAAVAWVAQYQIIEFPPE